MQSPCQEVAHWEIFNRMSEASETSLYVDHRDFAAYGKQHAFRNYLLLADVLTAISDPFDFQRIISYRNRLIVEHVPAPNVDIELSESESEALDSDEASSSESFELFMQGAQTPEAEEASDEESDNSLSLSSLSELTDEEIGFLNTANG